MSFELLQLTAGQVADDVWLVELEGRVPGGAPDVAVLATSRVAVPPIGGSVRADGDTLAATFALSGSALRDPLRLLAGDLAVDLPAPDGELAARLGTLAREANDLRHTNEALGHRLAETEQALEDTRERLTRAQRRAQAAEDRAAKAVDSVPATAPAPPQDRPRPAAPVRAHPPGRVGTGARVVAAEQPPAAIFALLAGLGVIGFILVMTVLL